MIAVLAQKAQNAHDNEVDGNDVVQQSRSDQDKNACNERYEGSRIYVYIHNATAFMPAKNTAAIIHRT
jgi:hypothetical protein